MALIGNQNVLRLQVTVVDPNGMAILNGIQDLEERMLGELIVSNESAVLGDVREEVSFGTEFDDHKGAVRTVENTDQ